MRISRIILVAFIAQLGYFLLAALVFGHGQDTLHLSAAAVAGVYLTTRLLRGRGKLRLMAPLAWAILAAGCFVTLQLWMRFIDWTLADFLPVNVWVWNTVRLLDLVFVSILIGFGAVTLRKRASRRTKHI